MMVMWDVLRDVESCDNCQYVLGLFEGSLSLRNFFLSVSFYHKIKQTMQIQEIPRKSKVLGAPHIFLI